MMSGEHKKQSSPHLLVSRTHYYKYSWQSFHISEFSCKLWNSRNKDDCDNIFLLELLSKQYYSIHSEADSLFLYSFYTY